MDNYLFNKIQNEENANYVLTPDGKMITCAMIIQNSEGEILGCHATGKAWNKTTFDLPKGRLDKSDSSPIDAAIREVKEETGWDISDKKKDVIDLGQHKYTGYSDIHLFYLSSEIPNLKSLHCDSTFINQLGKELPEMNGYSLIKPNELDWFYKSLQNVLSNIEAIKNEF